jgi:pimeloyl-ACP methyl ester carboxylesterase
MRDPSLGARLSKGSLPPTLVAWGESDRVVDAEFGRAYAQAIKGATFTLMKGAGHLPQMETPEALVETVWPFVVEHGQHGLR